VFLAGPARLNSGLALPDGCNYALLRVAPREGAARVGGRHRPVRMDKGGTMIHRILCAGLVSACLAILPTLAAAETFLLVPGVAGDAVEKNHRGWVRVSTVNWTVEATTSWTQGGGASVGKPGPDVLRMTIPTGPWSTAFVRAIITGTQLGGGQRLTLDHTASDGRPLYRLGLDGVFVTKYTIASSAPDLPGDVLEVVFKTVKFEQFFVGADGRTGSTSLGWDVSSGSVN